MKELRTAAAVLERLSHNQDALRAAVEELAKWVGDLGLLTLSGMSKAPSIPWTTTLMRSARVSRSSSQPVCNLNDCFV